MALSVRWFAVGLAALTLIRLTVAAHAPLAPDETYYWIWSHALAAGYLDHPPMVAIWIRLGTLLAGETALGVRLMGPLAAAVASWMLFDAGRRLFSDTKACIVAPLLLNATLLLGVGTVIMTPDSPLLFFWTATLWAMARVASPRVSSGISPRVSSGEAARPDLWWLAAGVFGGLALDSKYTALLLWVGVGLWVVWVPSVRPWLRRWQPWAASAIGFALFAPVLVWNAAHDWAGFIKQGGRVENWRPTRALGFLAELVGGQVGLATPLVWALCIVGLAVALQRACRPRDPAWSLLAALSLPPIVVFAQHALGDRVQGNWPAIVYPALALAAGAVPMRPRWWIGASALGFAVTVLTYAQATNRFIPLPPRLDPIAIRLAGWDGLARQVEDLRQDAGGAFVAADGYTLASELAWWLPNVVPVIGTDERWALVDLEPAVGSGATGLLVRDARRADPPDPAKWSEVQQIGATIRPGAPGSGFAVYRVTAGQGSVGMELPRR